MDGKIINATVEEATKTKKVIVSIPQKIPTLPMICLKIFRRTSK